MLVALAGSFEVTVDDGRRRESITLSRSSHGYFIPHMVWRELARFSSGAICLALASHVYDENDYHRDYDEYLLRPRRPMTEQVPFLELGRTSAELALELTAAIARVVDSGSYVLGAEVDAFEREFAAACRRPPLRRRRQRLRRPRPDPAGLGDRARATTFSSPP